MPQPQSAFIKIQHLQKAYSTPAGDYLALKGIDLQINAGEFVAVIGKSGSGKSTLINMLTGIDHPSKGSVSIGGTEIHTLNETAMARWRGRNLGIVFQFFQLLPTLTLIENIMLPMDLNNTLPPKERRDYAHQLLELVEMAHQADKLPSAVSGGQQQRVAIARALANDPPLIVADEPTGNLDSATAEKIFQLFEGLVASGKTIIMVTHDDTLARRATRSIMIADGEVVDPNLRAALDMLNQDQIIELKRAVTPQYFAPGKTLVQQGTTGDVFYILLEGDVEVFHQNGTGEEVQVNHLVPGQYFGEMALMGNGLRQNTVRASSQTPVAVAALDRAAFDRLMQSSPSMRKQIGETIEERLEKTRAALEAANAFKEKFEQVQTMRTIKRMPGTKGRS